MRLSLLSLTERPREFLQQKKGDCFLLLPHKGAEGAGNAGRAALLKHLSRQDVMAAARTQTLGDGISNGIRFIVWGGRVWGSQTAPVRHRAAMRVKQIRHHSQGHHPHGETRVLVPLGAGGVSRWSASYTNGSASSGHPYSLALTAEGTGPIHFSPGWRNSRMSEADSTAPGRAVLGFKAQRLPSLL